MIVRLCCHSNSSRRHSWSRQHASAAKYRTALLNGNLSIKPNHYHKKTCIIERKKENINSFRPYLINSFLAKEAFAIEFKLHVPSVLSRFVSISDAVLRLYGVEDWRRICLDFTERKIADQFDSWNGSNDREPQDFYGSRCNEKSK